MEYYLEIVNLSDSNRIMNTGELVLVRITSWESLVIDKGVLYRVCYLLIFTPSSRLLQLKTRETSWNLMLWKSIAQINYKTSDLGNETILLFPVQESPKNSSESLIPGWNPSTFFLLD